MTLRGVTIHLVIGTKDTTRDHIEVPLRDARLMEPVSQSGHTSIARTRTLEATRRAAGCNPILDWVPGAGHAVRQIFPAVEAFPEPRLAAVSPAEHAPT